MSQTDEARQTDATLVLQGLERIEWIRSRMPMLRTVRSEFLKSKPFVNHRIGVSLHIEPKTAVLLEVLQAGGGDIVGTGNYGSTQNDIAAFLASLGMRIFGKRDDRLSDHEGNLTRVLEARPDILLDNGADLASGVVTRGDAHSIIGATEETTSGGRRLRTELDGKIPFPSIVINDSPLKRIGENKHAVGQSVVESFMRITNLMVPARRFTVLGYGWCGRGIAHYLRALGGKVAVVETDEIKALEAALDGFRVGALEAYLSWAEVFITATGRDGVLPAAAVAGMSDGAILMNTGHFPWEIEVERLLEMATNVTDIDGTLTRLNFDDGTHVVLVANGRMMNLAGPSPKGNSIESMDLGFTLQALSLERVAQDNQLPHGAQPVPDSLNRRIALMMLQAMGSDA